MANYLKNLFFFSASFSQKAGRFEYGLYVLLNTSMLYLANDLNRYLNLDSEKILNLFYICLITLLTFVPMQAVTTRRLRDLNVNPAFIIFNFIPIFNFVFILFLLLADKKLLKRLKKMLQINQASLNLFDKDKVV